MISEKFPRAIAIAIAFFAGGLAGGCGNYSNEDLEYMNALPHRDDLSANLKSPLVIENEAELSKFTHDTTRDFNGVLEFLDNVELIRSFPPTSRGPQSRTWGPVPAAQGGWQWRFVVTRDPTMPERFVYFFELQRLTDAPGDWAALVVGSFEAATGVRRGVGQFSIQTGALRQRSFPFGPDVGFETITVSYDTVGFPVRVEMFIDAVNAEADYQYEAHEDGHGSMRFRLRGDLVHVTTAEDELSITSRWLPSGAGRADAIVTLGDAMGGTRTQCWNESFQQTFNHTDWDASTDFGTIDDCPVFPTP